MGGKITSIKLKPTLESGKKTTTYNVEESMVRDMEHTIGKTNKTNNEKKYKI